MSTWRNLKARPVVRRSPRSGRTSSLRTSASKRARHRRTRVVTRQLDHRCLLEHAADDGRALRDLALRGREPLQARREQEADGRRDRDVLEARRRAPGAVLVHARGGRRRRASRAAPRRTAGCPRRPRRPARRPLAPSAEPPGSASIRRPTASPGSGSSRMVVAFSLPPPHPGCSSSSSGRAGQRTRMAASRTQSATCSISSRSVRSAQWMSSITTTSGRLAARCSRSRRTAQATSSWGAWVTDRPIAAEIRSARSSASGSPSRRARTFARAASASSASVIPAASRTISPIGQ